MDGIVSFVLSWHIKKSMRGEKKRVSFPNLVAILNQVEKKFFLKYIVRIQLAQKALAVLWRSFLQPL